LIKEGKPVGSTDSDAFLHDILSNVKTIAVVGASDKESRPSHGVFGFLLAQGYHVIGVNPNLAGKSVQGAPFYKTLADVPRPIDMVDIFRNSEAAAGAVEEDVPTGLTIRALGPRGF
jgi:predicted CoA-binding protein